MKNDRRALRSRSLGLSVAARFPALAAGMLFLAIFPLAAQTADEIVEKSKTVNEAKSTQIQMQLTVTDRKGGVKTMLVEQYGIDAGGLSKSVIVFKQPASVAGTRFLVEEADGGAENRKIFLPELGKVRRISASEGGGSFMGTDFSYDDISTAARDTARDTHNVVREESVNGSACWVIQSVPKEKGDSQYSKSLRWISKDHYLTLKSEMYDKGGSLLKTLDIGKYENKSGYWTPIVTTISNVQENTSTAMELKAVIYDKPIPAGVFTEKFLMTGRP